MKKTPQELFTIKSFPHDIGTYREVMVYFDDKEEGLTAGFFVHFIRLVGQRPTKFSVFVLQEIQYLSYRQEGNLSLYYVLLVQIHGQGLHI